MNDQPLRLTILGTSFDVLGKPETLNELTRLWSPFTSVERASSAADVAVDAADLATATSELNRMALERYRQFAAHAGVAAIDGRVVAMPAESGTGKTTMVAACVASGWTYVSDEALCLRYDDGRVVPFPKPLALSPWSAAAVGLQREISRDDELLATAADLGGEAAGGVLELTDVVRLERSPGEPALLTELHRAEAVQLVLGMSFNHFRNRAEAFALVTQLAQRCRTWSLRYGDPLQAAALLRSGLR